MKIKNLKVAVCFIISLILIGYVSVELYGEQISPSQIDPAIVDSTQMITQYTVGDTLGSLNDLNVVAMHQGAVFIYIPTAQQEVITSETKTALLEAQKSLLDLDVMVGLYTLSVNSADYPLITKQITPPAFIVASKGGGMVPVTGEITRDYLLQAFLTANNSTTCGQ